MNRAYKCFANKINQTTKIYVQLLIHLHEMEIIIKMREKQNKKNSIQQIEGELKHKIVRFAAGCIHNQSIYNCRNYCKKKQCMHVQYIPSA
jgi:hypothetical protein